MFWDNVAWAYDLFVNIYNKKVHKGLCAAINTLIVSSDQVLECACGTGMLTVGISKRCQTMIATDFSAKMLSRAKKKCYGYSNVNFEKADILSLDYQDESFDKVIAANVIHLLDEPLRALNELVRVCRHGGKIIIPTYMIKEENRNTNSFTQILGDAGADFKRQFTYAAYRQFFSDAGYLSVDYTMIGGRVPCAIAVITKR